MIQYLIRFPLWLLVIIARYPLAFIAVAFQKDLQLQWPFRWLDTIDNNLTGDSGWKSEHLSGSDPKSYWNMVRWIWRNGGNRFNYYVIGIADDDIPEWSFWSKTSIPLWGIRFLDLRFGWSPEGPKQGRRKYVFTIRVKTKS